MIKKERIKTNFKADFVKKDIYTFYNKEIKSKLKEGSKELKDAVSHGERFNEILTSFNHKFVAYALKGFKVKMPYGLGSIHIKRKDPLFKFDTNGVLDPYKTQARVNWGATMKLWKEKPQHAHKTYLYYENHETDSQFLKILWIRNATKISKNNTIYKFVPSRTFRMKLYQHMINSNRDISIYDEYINTN